MIRPKYYICPMSRNIVDVVLEMDSTNFGLIPTRRQIDWDGGYVNGWDTKSFYNYVKSKNDTIVLERDHAGELQGKFSDDGHVSYSHDTNYFDIIHIDPWKLCNDNWKNGADATIKRIEYLYSSNKETKYEISTEESIRYFTDSELKEILDYIKTNLDLQLFQNIEYVVVQSGVDLDLVNMKNIGIYNENRLKSFIKIVKSFGKKCKEHNGDYLSNDELITRFDIGVDSINIGPEIAQIETLTYLNYMSDIQIDEFYKICLESKKWERWTPVDFDFTDKKKLIQVCGHYCFQLYDLPKIDIVVKENIKNKLKSLP